MLAGCEGPGKSASEKAPRAMDPTTEELASLETVVATSDWVGVPSDVRDSLFQLLGNPVHFRDIVRAVWDAVARRTKGRAPPSGEGSEPSWRDLTPTESSRIEMFRRVCHFESGC